MILPGRVYPSIKKIGDKGNLNLSWNCQTGVIDIELEILVELDWNYQKIQIWPFVDNIVPNAVNV